MEAGLLLKNSANKLMGIKIKNPRFEAEILLSFILKKTREYVLAHPEIKLSQNQIKNFNRLVARRIKGEPIAYITGKKSFYGLDFIVNKHTLVPRPETELLVDEALSLIARNLELETNNQKNIVFDIGTGSGCIIIALAKKLKSKNISYIASDVSPAALSAAKKNAKKHNVDKKIKFFSGNLLAPILKYLKNNKNFKEKKNILILANLPYLTPAQIKNAPSIQAEPRLALDAGPDGLKYYRRLFKQIKKLSLDDVAKISLFCEIDPGQTKKIKQLAQNELPQYNFKIKKDLAGNNRLVIIDILNS